MKKELEMDQIFRALGDKHRIQILELLLEQELNAGELLEQINVVQSTLSHHMKSLCESGLVAARKAGKWTYYSVSQEVVAQAGEFLRKYLQGPEGTAQKAAAEKPARAAAAKAVKTAATKAASEKPGKAAAAKTAAEKPAKATAAKAAAEKPAKAVAAKAAAEKPVKAATAKPANTMEQSVQAAIPAPEKSVAQETEGASVSLYANMGKTKKKADKKKKGDKKSKKKNKQKEK